jgi:hypothetical protein
MDRQNDAQLELFSESSSDNTLRVRTNSNPGFLKRIRGHEKIIILSILIFIVGVVSFSFGVHRGKEIALSANIKPIEIVKPEIPALQPAPVVAAVQAPQVLVKKEAAIKQPSLTASGGSFTIQVASYKTKSSALKEAESFKKRGLATQVLVKGKYVILCVGNFPNKESAQPLLTELSKNYKSCIIRRL